LSAPANDNPANPTNYPAPHLEIGSRRSLDHPPTFPALISKRNTAFSITRKFSSESVFYVRLQDICRSICRSDYTSLSYAPLQWGSTSCAYSTQHHLGGLGVWPFQNTKPHMLVHMLIQTRKDTIPQAWILLKLCRLRN
jgi:hypothetical protein